LVFLFQYKSKTEGNKTFSGKTRHRRDIKVFHSEFSSLTDHNKIIQENISYGKVAELEDEDIEGNDEYPL